MFSQYLDYFCVGFCVLHMIYEVFSNKSMQRKIVSLCSKCFKPVVSDVLDDSHVCGLSSDQLDLLVRFVSSMRGDNNAS